MKTEIKIQKRCSCGKLYLVVPDTRIVTKNDDFLDGVWFNCDRCHSSMIIPRATIDPALFNLIAEREIKHAS